MHTLNVQSVLPNYSYSEIKVAEAYIVWMLDSLHQVLCTTAPYMLSLSVTNVHLRVVVSSKFPKSSWLASCFKQGSHSGKGAVHMHCNLWKCLLKKTKCWKVQAFSFTKFQKLLTEFYRFSEAWTCFPSSLDSQSYAAEDCITLVSLFRYHCLVSFSIIIILICCKPSTHLAASVCRDLTPQLLETKLDRECFQSSCW